MRGARDGAGVSHVHGQRLFHHHVDVTPRAGFDRRGMVEGAGEQRHGFGLHAIEHGAEFGEENGIGQAVALCVVSRERCVRLRDACDDDVFTLAGGLQEPVDMAVDQAGDTQAQGLLGGGDQGQKSGCEDQLQEDMHSTE